jgi:hypothetical protein
MFGKRKSFNRPEGPRSDGRRPSQHLLVEAAAFVTFVSGGGRPHIMLTGLREPSACKSSKSNGVSFLFDTKEGVSGKFYFFPEFASAWPDGEPAPRHQIPTEMIANRVSSYPEALRSLLATVPPVPDMSTLVPDDIRAKLGL